MIWMRWFWLRRLHGGMTKKQISLRFGRPEKTWSYPTHDVWLFLLRKHGDWRDGYAFVFKQDKVAEHYFMTSQTQFDA
jgi:hypothetical protein